MERDPRAFLWDVHQAGQRIETFVHGRDLKDYLADPMLRSAVDRQFEIIGEALNQFQGGTAYRGAYPRRLPRGGDA
jgi:uncharacterized protein with HEPN domain